MACMDFVPANQGGGGMFSSPVFGTFSSCLDSANQWLAQNPTSRVLNCETITLKGLHGSRYEFHSEFSMTTDHYTRRSGKSTHTYGSCELKGLRLWYLPDNTGPPQRIGYTTLVPTCLDTSGKPQYEDFQTTISKYNQQVAYQAPQGYVLNIELVQQLCGPSGKMDPERTCYQHKTFRLNLIRIWLVIGSSVPEEIGCADFVPQSTTVNGERGLEDMRTVLARAQSWLASQGGVRFTNIESLHFKVKSDHVDSQRPLSHYWVYTEMVQFVRLWYVKPLGDVPVPRPPFINFYTVEPAKARTGGARECKFETIYDMSRRYYQWLMQCGARILSVQTVSVPCKIGSSNYPPEQARHVLKKHSKLFLRVYFDGEFRPPWDGILPAPQPVEDAGCSVL